MRVEHLRQVTCKTALLTAVVIVWCSSKVELLTLQQQRNLDTEVLFDIVTAVEKATSFFEEDYASINVDGLFGIRLCQGSITESLNDCSLPKFHCPDGLTDRVSKINSKLSTMTEMSMPYVQQQDPEYYQRFLQVIDSPYIVQYISEPLGDSVTAPGFDDHYDEEKGDKCYESLLGTFSDNQRTYPKCTISDSCWKLMTKGETSHYFITHQLLYFIIGEKNGCLDDLEKHVHRNNGTSVREVERYLCGKIYSEAKEEETSGKVATIKQDLFLEQIVLCGILGFKDFFNREWMEMILGWQSAKGCFSLPGPLMDIQGELNVIADKQRWLLDLLTEEANQIDKAPNVWMGRKLMREQTMPGDCLAHKTGLAFGTLGTFIRNLIHRLYSH